MKPILYHIVFVLREFVGSTRAGGISTYVKETSEGLANYGYKVTVLTASDDTREEKICIENDVTIHYLSGGEFCLQGIESDFFYLKKFRPIYRFLSYRWKLKKTIQQLDDVSIIEVAEYGAEGLFLQNLGIPLVIRLHLPALYDKETNGIIGFSHKNIHNYWRGLIELYLVKKAKFRSSPSQFLAKWFEREIDIVPNQIKIIPYVLEVREPKSPTKITKKTIFFAGALIKGKGIFDLIEAVALLRQENTNICLNLAGYIGKKNLKMAAYYEKKYEWCRFLGLQSREQLYPQYKAATICCFPSRADNFPFTCLEALSVGGIVLGSNNCGISEMITEGKNGFLIQPKDPKRLAEKLKTLLLLSEEERANISKNAIESIKENYSQEVILRKMIAYYEECIENQANY